MTPTLAFLADAGGPLSFRVFVDGALLQESRTEDSRGEILLPPIKLGMYRVKCVPSRPVRLYINYVNPGGSPILLKRLANRFGASGLEFSYDKRTPGDELLSGRLLVAPGVKERLRVRVTVETPAAPATGPFPSFTFPDRVFDLMPAGGSAVPVLGTATETTDAGQPIFLPLGSDLPPGSYRIRFALEQGPGGYLSISKITPGAYEARNFFVEKETQDE